MRFLDLIYLDPALVSEIYTAVTGVSPVTKMSKAQDLAGSVGAGLFHLGGTMRETREFTVSTTQMYFEIESKLSELPSLQAPEAFATRSLFWMNGILVVGSMSLRRNETLKREVGVFMIVNPQSNPDWRLDLAAKDEYFTSGYDRMAAEKELLGQYVREPIRALLRPAFSDPGNQWHAFTPVVILRE